MLCWTTSEIKKGRTAKGPGLPERPGKEIKEEGRKQVMKHDNKFKKSGQTWIGRLVSDQSALETTRIKANKHRLTRWPEIREVFNSIFMGRPMKLENETKG
jgi:hypothetical protein